jgi:hypothetical protein
VHWTTATQRFWNWLGSIPHWIYPTVLRSDVLRWSQVVIWSSLIGVFLTALGLGLGVIQFRGGSRRKLSPYRGWLFWHHISGLVFGIFALAWVVSGLVSMNPWGFLEGRRGGGEQARAQGSAPHWREVRGSLDALRLRSSLASAVSLASAPLDGRLYWLAAFSDGTRTRLDAAGEVAVPTPTDLAEAAKRIAGTTAIVEQGFINGEDAYYFGGRSDDFVLPAYRVILGNADRTRYYLDPRSGAFLQRADANARWHRWLFGGLHRIDFTAWIRARPLWDIVVLALLLGGVTVSGTGAYLAWRRICGDLIQVWRFLRRRRTHASSVTRKTGAINA